MTCRSILLLLASLLLAACATEMKQADPATAQAASVAFQNSSLSPKNGGKLIGQGELLPGDIILSATDGITSAGIRLFTLAPVSHAALYVGDDLIAEAVGEGVRLRAVSQVLEEEAVVVAFRRSDLTVAQAAEIRHFAEAQVGRQYNYVGVMLHAPFSIERRICDLPLMPAVTRDACMRGIATIQLGTPDNDRFFCSQFVIEAYRVAGLPITDVNPRWVSPADILHMREDDVPSIKIHQPLVYVGHLKFQASPAAALARR
ncbi:hypothetical protein IGB42_00528 [Andreprevotia sp. IGB-42]|uniref:YaeF family permuted papain-like enzyme n=1 Tax=Andreprevotia sp. IGB-42 TaxID=2497473 RepID=UPI00135A071D|nr:YaeF family permuted papain-like enzyme [Andreprevotia sp. IGB-42]KAF0815447.1 hypothetical protein IGB42_00528 [Andreprevotia sp. IGB-42]